MLLFFYGLLQDLTGDEPDKMALFFEMPSAFLQCPTS